MRSSPKSLIFMLAATGVLVSLAILGAGAWFIVSSEGAGLTGDLAGLAVEELQPEEEYQPTSMWIEEGLDPDVTTLGFSGSQGEQRARRSGPELSETQLQNLVYEKQNSLMTCYADALDGNPDLKGRVFMQFGVASDGHVAMVKVTRSTLRSKSTEDCLVAMAREWQFPSTNRSALMKFDTDFTFVYE